MTTYAELNYGIGEAKWNAHKLYEEKTQSVHNEFSIMEEIAETEAEIRKLKDKPERTKSDEQEIEGLADELEELHKQLEANRKFHQEAVLLCDTEYSSTVPQLLAIRLSQEVLDDNTHYLHHYMDKKDIKWNRFQLLGEAAHANGHITVIGMSTGRLYTMLHDNYFEIIPPQEN